MADQYGHEAISDNYPNGHPNNVISPTKPVALPGFMKDHPAFVGKLTTTYQQANDADGDMQDNGSAFYTASNPAKTPDGKDKGIPGANAREAKRKTENRRSNDPGGKGGGVHQS